MRVVAGIAKGRQLKSPTSPNVRPIMDRVKTALFDILAPEIEGARFLDLFAGAGGVGIEALSRGAESATFVELDAETAKLIGENLRITGLGQRAETLHADAFRYSERAHASGKRYDIVYVAPPQYQGMARRALAQLDARPLTEIGGLVIVQIDPRERTDVDALHLHTLAPIDERRYGGTLLIFYEHSDQGDQGDQGVEDHEDTDDNELE
jgi:16S rRNA (guanine(966)-N(2))-methyltransferase RsmD